MTEPHLYLPVRGDIEACFHYNGNLRWPEDGLHFHDPIDRVNELSRHPHLFLLWEDTVIGQDEDTLCRYCGYGGETTCIFMYVGFNRPLFATIAFNTGCETYDIDEHGYQLRYSESLDDVIGQIPTHKPSRQGLDWTFRQNDEFQKLVESSLQWPRELTVLMLSYIMC